MNSIISKLALEIALVVISCLSLVLVLVLINRLSLLKIKVSSLKDPFDRRKQPHQYDY